MVMLKSRVGMPPVQYHGEKIDLEGQARRARSRLYPTTVVYSAGSLAVLVAALRSPAPAATTLAWYAAGWPAWTLLEYFAHRWVLHYTFPDGPGLQGVLHRAFDSLHAEHHARPWDGDHINGTIRDTLIYVVAFTALSFLAPLHTVPVLWGAVLQGYVVEEWVHHASHYPTVYGLRGRYWRYVTRHHAYHHSPRGSEVAFGLTNGFWDVVFGTRIPAEDRALLYRPRRASSGTSARAA